MKIAVFHNIPPGGAKRTVYEQVKGLSKNNKVDVYEIESTFDNFIDPKSHADNSYIYKISLESNLPWIFKRIYKDLKNFVGLYILHRQIAIDINERGYDVALIHPDEFLEAPYILRFIKIPKVYHCHELLRIGYERQLDIIKDLVFYKRYYERLTRKLRTYIDKKNVQKADFVVTSSIFIKRKVALVYLKKAIVCHPGVDFSVFKKRGTRENQVLFIGNKTKNEGYDLARKAINSMAKGFRPSIKVLEFKNKRPMFMDDIKVAKEYSKSIATLCLDYQEPFGLKAIESMACETPVIAVNEGGYKESIVDGKNGFLIKRDYKVLADKILILLKDGKLVEKLGKEGRKFVVKYWRWDRHVEEVEKVLKSSVIKNEKYL